MLTAVDMERSYHELIEMVCDRQSEICMIHRCKNCPGIEPIETVLSVFASLHEAEICAGYKG